MGKNSYYGALIVGAAVTLMLAVKAAACESRCQIASVGDVAIIRQLDAENDYAPTALPVCLVCVPLRRQIGSECLRKCDR